MGLLDSNYSAVNGKKPRNSDKQYEQENLLGNAKNAAGLLADFTPVIGGIKGAYEEAKAGNPVMSAVNAATVPIDLLSGGVGGAAVKAGLLGTVVKHGDLFRGLENAFDPKIKKAVEWYSATPELANTYGKNVVTKGAGSADVADLGFRDYMTEVKQDNVLDRVKRSVVENFQAGKIDKNKAMSLNDKIEDMRGSSNEYKRAHEFINTPEIASILKDSGYDAISHVENGHQTFGFLNPAVNTRPLTEFEQRHLTAQKNAALPVEQGGLGLPVDNTAMQRAYALGYTTPAYHGSGRDFTEFKNSMLGVKTGAKSAQKAHFFASNPEVSNTYVNTSHVYNDSPPVYEKLFNNPEAFDAFTKAETKDAKWAVLENNGMNYSSGQVMPVLVNQGKTRVKDYGGVGYRDATYNDELIAAKKAKKDSVELKNTYDRGPHEGSNAMTDIYAVFDPSNIRSRFAAFDPMRRHEADLLGYADPRLLAGIAGGGLLGLGGYSLIGDK